MADDILIPDEDALKDLPLGQETEEEAVELDSSEVITASDVQASGGLTDLERQRLKRALEAAWAVPFIGDIRDFAWEAIFHYVKGLYIPDSLNSGTSKRLFDVVDEITSTGWSLKALVISESKMPELAAGAAFEFVIQRSDIFKLKNYNALGLGKLDIDTPPAILGAALVEYWQRKVKRDRGYQTVTNQFVGFLLKTKDRKQYLYFQQPLSKFEELTDDTEYEWVWTDQTKTGLQARRRDNKRVLLRWYPNQKQLFQCLSIPADAKPITIEPRRLDNDSLLEILIAALKERQQGNEPVS